MLLVPATNVIVGPLNGRHGLHFCLAERLWTRLRTPLHSEGHETNAVECHSFCAQQVSLSSPLGYLAD